MTLLKWEIQICYHLYFNGYFEIENIKTEMKSSIFALKNLAEAAKNFVGLKLRSAYFVIKTFSVNLIP